MISLVKDTDNHPKTKTWIIYIPNHGNDLNVSELSQQYRNPSIHLLSYPIGVTQTAGVYLQLTLGEDREYTHSLSHSHLGVISNLQSTLLWEETREEPHSHWESMQTPHTPSFWPGREPKTVSCCAPLGINKALILCNNYAAICPKIQTYKLIVFVLFPLEARWMKDKLTGMAIIGWDNVDPIKTQTQWHWFTERAQRSNLKSTLP